VSKVKDGGKDLLGKRHFITCDNQLPLLLPLLLLLLGVLRRMINVLGS